MQESTVKFYYEEKGFGFITLKNGGSEIFVHAKSLEESVRENNEVRYEIAKGEKRS